MYVYMISIVDGRFKRTTKPAYLWVFLDIHMVYLFVCSFRASSSEVFEPSSCLLHDRARIDIVGRQYILASVK